MQKTGAMASSLVWFPKDSEGLPHLPGTIFIGESRRSPRGANRERVRGVGRVTGPSEAASLQRQW